MKQQFPILIIAAASLLYACTNPFTTRADKVEKPNLSNFVYQSYDQYDHVIDNFRTSLRDKNVSEYMNTLSQDAARFRFVPEAAYANEFRARGWTLEDEQVFYNTFKAAVGNVTFQFDEGGVQLKPIFGTSLDDSVESELTHYRMTVALKDSVREIEGLLRFKLYHDHERQRWHIYYWEDKAINDRFEYTFTYLKSAYYD